MDRKSSNDVTKYETTGIFGSVIKHTTEVSHRTWIFFKNKKKNSPAIDLTTSIFDR